MNILLTGATGFIGQAVIRDLLAHTSYHISALVRRASDSLPGGIDRIEVDAIDGNTDYSNILAGFDVIIHLAARVHRLNENRETAYYAYKSINVDGTLNLARQAAAAGVSRFIFLSSIKVNGESTRPGRPFKADDPPNPSDPYAISKYESELGLASLAESTGMEFVVIRPPLVYGPGVKANFQRLMGLIRKGLPLPFGSIDNLRSLVSIDNLTSLIRHCIDHPKAANKVFLVSDDRDVSTPELLRMIASGMQLRSRLIAFPKATLNLVASLFGKEEIARRLLDNLQVDITKTKSELGWQPESTMEEAVRQTAINYLQHAK